MRYYFCMTSKRGYGEVCPIAHSLDMIGDRWALLVIRELRLGPKRFTDLQAGLPNAGPTVLAQRLRELEEAGVIQRRMLAPPASSRVYELTEWGAELEPVFGALARWGMRSPRPRSGDLSADSVMLGMRTFFDSQGIPPWSATYEVRLDRDSYRIKVERGRLVELRHGDFAGRADAVLTCDRMTLHELGNRTLTVRAAVDGDRLILTGDTKAVQTLFRAIHKS